MSKIVSVQDLIDELNLVSDKTLPIFIYETNEETCTIDSVDDSISDRIDLNSGEM